MPCVLSKPLLVGLASVLVVGIHGADVLPQLPWAPCADTPSWDCADLYFCARNQTDWQYWGVKGAVWPLPPRKDPLGANGFLYGYQFEGQTECIPGQAPLIRMAPGKSYRLTLHNTADRDLPTQEMINQMLAIPVNNIYVYPGNTTLHQRHMTNLHQHGLHISGEGDSDNVFKILQPGNCLTYKYIIPASHVGGTNWYHPHFHGKISFQVIGGSYGMTVIEDTATNLVTAAGAALPASTLSFFTDKTIERHLSVYSMLQLWMGNGNPFGATVPLVQNQWHRIRVSYVRPEGILANVIFSPLTRGMTCTMYEIAWDGVYASQVPYMATGGALPLTFRVHGAQRGEYALQCSTTGTVQMQYNGGLVALFQVAAGNPTLATPFNSGAPWNPKRPNYLSDLRDGSPTVVNGVLGLHTMQVQLTAAQSGISWDNGPFKMLDESWTVPIAALAYGSTYVHEINFQNTIPHPMHMHQQHFQVVQPGGCGAALKEGEWYDTISSESGIGVWQDCKVRFQFIDYSGSIVVHCHVLDHEDTGIAGFFSVPAGPGAFETSALYTNKNFQTNCCVPRTNANGVVICQGTASCLGPVNGADTCNKPCVIPQITCPITSACALDGTCVTLSKRGREAICDSGLKTAAESTTDATASTPVYPFVIMGIALGVAVVAVAGAAVIVRNNKVNYRNILMDEVKAQNEDTSGHTNTPFATPVMNAH